MVPKSAGFKKLWKFSRKYFVPYMGILLSTYIRNDLSITPNEYDLKTSPQIKFNEMHLIKS